jgi:exopolyphosphatase/guanosine-5'-triphosphate,3'-diphosphate pyrophosphatase
MSGQQVAVIDLGTNTFHLLVVRAGNDMLEQVYRERIFINLAEDGIAQIGKKAWQRAIDALLHYHTVLQKLHIDKTIAIGTAALRTASNAPAFIDEVRRKTGIHIEVISGEREAKLIAIGVREAIPPLLGTGLIMDIGGGSVEFILIRGEDTLFRNSYPVGVAVLHRAIHKTEPITPAQLEALDTHLEDVCDDMLRILQDYPDSMLIGASGTFEVIDRVLHPHAEGTIYSTFSHDAFDNVYREVIALDLSERLAHPGIPDTRAQYIVVAMHLIAFVLRHLHRSEALISKYAMKEGLAAEWLINLDKAKY